MVLISACPSRDNRMRPGTQPAASYHTPPTGGDDLVGLCVPLGDDVEQVALGGAVDVGSHPQPQQVLTAAAGADRPLKDRWIGRAGPPVVDRQLGLHVGIGG